MTRRDAPADVDPALHRATANLTERTGATRLDIGYIEGDRPEWWAKATYPGAVIMVENHVGPNEAAHALCEKMLTGGQCQLCGGLIALSDEGAIAVRNGMLVDGRPWTSKEIDAAGQCRWRRDGDRWESGCVLPPEGDDELHTAEKLARALADRNDPKRLREIMWRARRGYYHDYLTPLSLPSIQLVADLRAAGHEDMAQRVIAGEFDSSEAEADAWTASADGRDAFRRALLFDGDKPRGYWRQQGSRPEPNDARMTDPRRPPR